MESIGSFIYRIISPENDLLTSSFLSLPFYFSFKLFGFYVLITLSFFLFTDGVV